MPAGRFLGTECEYSIDVSYTRALPGGETLLVAQRRMLPTRGVTLATGVVATLWKWLSPGGNILGHAKAGFGAPSHGKLRRELTPAHQVAVRIVCETGRLAGGVRQDQRPAEPRWMRATPVRA